MFVCTLSLMVAMLQVVELISGGAQIAVTNENKIHYLNLLAQYRLASQVREEVEHFLKGKIRFSNPISFKKTISYEQNDLFCSGLNELVPENLLAIFDENELEVRNSVFRNVPSKTVTVVP